MSAGMRIYRAVGHELARSDPEHASTPELVQYMSGLEMGLALARFPEGRQLELAFIEVIGEGRDEYLVAGVAELRRAITEAAR